LRVFFGRPFVRRFFVALVVASVISATAVLTVNVEETQKFKAIHTVTIPNNVLSPPAKPGAPTNYLIIGSDSRAFVDTPAQAKAFGSAKDVGGARSDVMMVVHLEPALGTALVVSFPRDTYVAIDRHGHDKLNAAFAYGGPELTIRTFRKDFGIPIQHFLEVNFEGFQKIVDAIGHVKIYFPTPARDVFTGLYQPAAGCASLDGGQALAYARSRHYLIPRDGVTNPDPNKPTEDWIEDPRSDLDRIQRQQYFLRSLGQAALNRAGSNPLTALHLADAVVSSMTKDQTLTNNELKSLVRTFRGLDPATVEMTTLPVTGGVGSNPLVAQYPEAQPLLDRLADLTRPRLVVPNPANPAHVKVVVVDGSGVKGRAAAVQAALVARGFRAGGTADLTSSNYAKTQVRYAPGQVSKGLTVALYLGSANVVEAASTTVKDGSRTLTGEVLVIVGRDYPSLQGLLALPIPTTAPSSAGTATSTSASTTTTTPTTTADTRYVPVSPKSVGPLVGCP
jgi:LCP family protein required for cell wall assembly